jgi:hypothetical protein
MKIDEKKLSLKIAKLSMMANERQPWWQLWRELAAYYLPSRYVFLESENPNQRISRRNSQILDGTGTIAARTLASGMMNGITSPARPWFKLRVRGIDEAQYPVIVEWADEVTRRMLTVMAESNFYNVMAILYLDLTVFGTACASIYESQKSIIHCQNYALGEYYLTTDAEHRVNGFAREFQYTVMQVVQQFGEENCSSRVKDAWKAGGARHLDKVSIVHMIEPTESLGAASQFQYEETYWEKGTNTGEVLRQRGYFEFPNIAPRWELTANDAYGTSPGMDALGDVIQLQHETKKKGQALDKLVSPPILADIVLENKPTALLPGGITYVPRLSENSGARPIYTVQPPLGEMTMDIRDVQSRIRETFHNDLFMMISQLETVRSATEIDARREEKLVLLGPVLERFENEALDPAIARIFGIMQRRNLLPELPPEVAEIAEDLEIQYVSILSAAQNAVATAPTERLLQVIGNLVPVFPEARAIPNIPELLRDYALDIGVKSKGLHTPEEVAELISGANEQNAQQAGMETATQGAEAAKLLSETQVGGGANALQRILGGVT